MDSHPGHPADTPSGSLSELDPDPARPQFDEAWQRRAFGVAVALAEFGFYRWEDFQRELIAAVGAWEQTPEDQRGAWSYYECWLEALDRVLAAAGVVDADELAVLRRQLEAERPDG